MSHKSVKDNDYLSQAQLNSIIRNTFITTDGKRALEFFIEEFSDRNSAVRGDPYMTHYNEGQRSVVNLIKKCIKGD